MSTCHSRCSRDFFSSLLEEKDCVLGRRWISASLEISSKNWEFGGVVAGMLEPFLRRSAQPRICRGPVRDCPMGHGGVIRGAGRQWLSRGSEIKAPDSLLMENPTVDKIVAV